VAENELIEKVVEVKRVSKVVKGGRRFSFNALVVVGDAQGKVGVSLGKANEVVEAVRKATEKAKKKMNFYNIYKDSIPHKIVGSFGATRVLMNPSPPGSGIISSGAVRAVMEAIGIKNINAKALGSTNAHNLVDATLNGLSQLRSFSEVAEMRGKKLEEICLIDF